MKRSILATLSALGLLSIIAYQHRSLMKLRQELSEAATQGTGATEPPARGQGDVRKAVEEESERLKQQNAALQRELSEAKRQASNIHQQLLETSSASAQISNQLAGAAQLVVTNRVYGNTNYAVTALEDVGTRNVENALQTCLKALTGTNSQALARVADPDSLLFSHDGAEIVFRDLGVLENVSDIRVSERDEMMDGSVRLACELSYNAGVRDTGPTIVVLTLRPSQSGWRLSDYSPTWIVVTQAKK